MKKLVLVLAVLCVTFALASCHRIETETEEDTTSEIIEEECSSKDTTNAPDTSIADTENNEETTSSGPAQIPDSPVTDSPTKDEPPVSPPSNTEKNPYKQATDSDNNVSVSSDGVVSITIPQWFLFKMEPDYNYQLTDAEAGTYKFISVTKNADGSATYKIGYNDYHGFMLISKSSVNSVVNKYKNNTWFSKIESDEGYNNINIYTEYSTLQELDEDFGAYIVLSGIQTTFYQYMNYNCSVGTVITVYNKDNAVLATYNFPDLLK